MLDDAVPASRFTPVPAAQRELLGLDIPAELRASLTAGSAAPVSPDVDEGIHEDTTDVEELANVDELEQDPPQGTLVQAGNWLGGQALALQRVVTRTGNISVGRQQIWVGLDYVGRTIGVWVDTTTIHLSLLSEDQGGNGAGGVSRGGGRHLKTVPSRLGTAHLARLHAAGAVPAGPPPVPVTAARGAPVGAVVEIDRTVNASGLIGLGNRYVSVGQPLAGQRVTLRFDGAVAHVIASGVLHRTIPAPVPAHLRGRLRGARAATDEQPPTSATRPEAVIVQRKVSVGGTTQVAGQTLRVGYPHRNSLVDVHVHQTEFQVYDSAGELLLTIPKTTSKEVTRFKAYGWTDNIG